MRKSTPHKTREGLLEREPGPTGKKLCVAGAGAPRPRVSLLGAEGKGPPSAWGQPRRLPTEPHSYRGAGAAQDRAAHTPLTPTSRSPSSSSQQLSPARGVPVPPRVSALSGWRMSCHFLLLACKRGSSLERYLSAFRAKRPPARRWVFGGRYRWGSVPAPHWGWIPLDLDSRSKVSPQEKERNV